MHRFKHQLYSLTQALWCRCPLAQDLAHAGQYCERAKIMDTPMSSDKLNGLIGYVAGQGQR